MSEWLSSKWVYLDNSFYGKKQKDLLKIFKKGFNRETLEKHYLSLARQNYEKYIRVDKKEVSLKKYVYILRALGCIEFIKKTDELPPLNWEKSSVYLPEEIRNKFSRMVELKKSSEKNKWKRDKELDEFIESKFQEKLFKREGSFYFEEIDKIVVGSIVQE